MDEDKKDNIEININLDTTPILYTDNIFMSTNDDGLVLDIGQKIGPSKQIRIVARVGMSKSHAKKFLKELGNLLLKAEGQIQTGKPPHRA